MPARSRRPDRPTFYLDTSTICDAVRAHVVPRDSGAHPAYAPLLPWLERVASEANLCVALVHLLELARRHDHESAMAVARWLDGVETVWVRQMVDVQEEEDEYWMRAALGVVPLLDVNPFAASMLPALGHLTPATSPDALAFSSLPKLVDVLRELDQSRSRAGVRTMVQQFHDDRRWAVECGWTDERKGQERGYRQRVEIRTRAHDARQRVLRRGETIAEHDEAGVHVQDLLVALVSQESLAMPSYRVADNFRLAWGDLAGRRTPGSKRASAMESTFEDFLHLVVGAAYCTVFTCDADVSECLGEARVQLGLARQMTVRELGGPDPFTNALMATWS